METVGMVTTKQSLVKRIAAQVLETDSYLIDKILNDNDKYAAETLIERHYKAIYKGIYIKVSDKELAMDLTQETFISVLRSLRQYEESKGSFRAWAAKIAQNKVIDYHRSRQYKESLITEVMDDVGIMTENVMDNVLDRSTSERIQELLKGADEVSRRIFWMKAREGYTFAEISERTGITVSGAKNKYYALIKVLRKEMQEYGQG